MKKLLGTLCENLGFFLQKSVGEASRFACRHFANSMILASYLSAGSPFVFVLCYAYSIDFSYFSDWMISLVSKVVVIFWLLIDSKAEICDF